MAWMFTLAEESTHQCQYDVFTRILSDKCKKKIVSAKLSDSLDQIKQNIALLTNNFGSSICL
jgi:hypothetical protein